MDKAEIKKEGVGILIASLKGGGAEAMALRLMKLLLDSGGNVYLFMLDRNFDMQIPGDDATRERIRSRIIPLTQKDIGRHTVSKVFTAVSLHFRLERLVNQLGISTMVSFMERANILNLTLKSIPQRIISVRIHIKSDLVQKSVLKRVLIKTLYPLLLCRANKINFNSRESADNFMQTFHIRKRKTSVIYNFCDAEELSVRAQQPSPWDADKVFHHPVVVTAGRLVPQKGHVHLLRAFAAFCDTDKDTTLIVLGDGPLKPELIHFAKRLDLDARVLFPGFQKNPMPCIVRADVFVLSSLQEGFPNALMEALCLGLPVISTDCPSGPREMLAPGTDPNRKTEHIDYAAFGILTPRFDRHQKIFGPISRAEEKMAQAIASLVHNPARREHYQRMARIRSGMFSETHVKSGWFNLLGLKTLK